MIGSLQVMLRSLLLAGLTQRSLTTVEVKAANQMQQQGVPIVPCVFFTNTFTKRIGWQSTKNIVGAGIDQIEASLYNVTFQISGLSSVTPTSAITFTTMDLILIASEILQSRLAVDTCLANGVGILRVTDIRAVNFVNDREQYQTNPTFDIIFQAMQTVSTPVPIIQKIVSDVTPLR